MGSNPTLSANESLEPQAVPGFSISSGVVENLSKKPPWWKIRGGIPPRGRDMNFQFITAKSRRGGKMVEQLPELLCEDMRFWEKKLRHRSKSDDFFRSALPMLSFLFPPFPPRDFPP
ncbi:MAG: hypothetical protein LBH86_03560 [Oscillospiraceae bacterium]|nr:hypothetical protein [Oscillospiraceae bacterium]